MVLGSYAIIFINDIGCFHDLIRFFFELADSRLFLGLLLRLDIGGFSEIVDLPDSRHLKLYNYDISCSQKRGSCKNDPYDYWEWVYF